jgi:imidazole glycerol phosphate synthase subunit HisF
VSKAVDIPVIASGGADRSSTFGRVLRAAVPMPHWPRRFSFLEHSVHDLKELLRSRGIPVRL